MGQKEHLKAPEEIRLTAGPKGFARSRLGSPESRFSLPRGG